MTVFPAAIDSDSELIRIDDNLTEVGGQAINNLRDATFALERYIGINPQGSLGSLSDRLNISINQNGTIKASALTSIGLATLPIVDNQVASNAGIKESKLALNYSTSSLHTAILANASLSASLAAFAATTNANLLSHIKGSITLADGSTPGRHVASQIDINAIPDDTRDPLFVWNGLVDKNGNKRTAANVATALAQINDDLVGHENAIANAHVASAINVDTSNFTEIPAEANTAQKAFQALDDSDRLQIGDHRATMHANGIPKHARSEQLLIDGYSQNIVPPTSATAFLVDPPATIPTDSNTKGDDIIKFTPTNTGFVFDSQFAQVKVGDIVTFNYGNGTVASFPVESIRFIPGSDWTIRINGKNLFNTDGYTSYARIDRPAFDENTYGVLAVAAANNNINSSIIGSVVIGSPRGATALGLGFDANQLDSTHYNLYLQLYPTGNPADKIIVLPAIDVTGNAGITPGQYTLDSVVAATNDAFRAAGFNYRFIAFTNNGELGVMLADPIDQAAFSIINGTISGASIIAGAFTNNVVGDATNSFDALGFGANKTNIASPPYVSSYASSVAASTFPTNIIVPLRRRNFAADGVRRDTFATTFMSVGDGYWAANLTNRTVVGVTTVEVTYTVPLDLAPAGLMPGKTIVVQPILAFADPAYLDADYGRFIIKSVSFVAPCGPVTGSTSITVINGVHANGNPIGVSSSPTLPVKLYFSADSVGFNAANVIDASAPATVFNRLHEIYITGDGNTFSHERARMPKQTEDATHLATTARWTIRNVSPKLRGFRDTGGSTFNKYVRFYVLDYNSTTAEYDGYLGKRDPVTQNVSNFGEITRARKNVPARFYDESNIDYVEIEFFDDTAAFGTNIMSTNVSRFVDIEIFPTLERDDEFMLLATCEVDNTSVRAVIDRREFGNTSEIDFTESAIDFITAGDRYLHENGVIKGFDFAGANPLDSHLLEFEGGLALVNGNVVAVNSESVAIPEIRQQGASLPATVIWAICVNETGQYVPIIITATKQQYFATKGAGNYYVPSVTFSELITRRKDLTLIYTAVATINSITLAVFDARRFIFNSGFSTDFVLTSDDEQYNGAFKSIAAVGVWINSSSASSFVVNVRGGDFVLSSLDLLTFTNFNGKKVTFDGSAFGRASTTSATFTFNTSITFAPNITFKNIDLVFGETASPIFGASTIIDGGSVSGINTAATINANSTVQKCIVNMGGIDTTLILNGDNCTFDSNIFVYTPAVTIGGSGTTYSANNYVNADNGAGCVVSYGPRQNIRFTKNAFSTTVGGTQRPPHIVFYVNSADEINRINITDNVFNDGNTTLKMCAIAVINTNTGGLLGAMITDSLIENNKCNGVQSILLTTNTTVSTLDIDVPGLHSVNTAIRKNACGNIGYVVANFDPSFVDLTNYRGAALTIEQNNCVYIANLNSFGVYKFPNNAGSLGSINLETADVIIKNNNTNWIHTSSIAGPYGSVKTGQLLIDGNNLSAFDQAYLTTFGAVLISPLNFGILVANNTAPGTDSGHSECRITNNTTDFGYLNSLQYSYLYSFDVIDTSCIMHGNTWRGVIDDSVNANVGAVSGNKNIITGNRFERNTSKVNSYILINNNTATGLITDNYFDTPTTDNNALHIVLVNLNSGGNKNFIVERNINQTVVKFINPTNGNFSLLGVGDTDQIIVGPSNAVNAKISYVNLTTVTFGGFVKFYYPDTGAGSAFSYEWIISTEDLPLGVKILGAGTTIASDAAAATIGTATISLVDAGGTFVSSSSSFSGAYTPNTPIPMTINAGSPTDYIVGNNTAVRLFIQINSGAHLTVSSGGMFVSYRW